MEFTGERVVPWARSMRDRPDLVQSHVARYNWVLSAVVGKTVVDLGCGTGYGAFLLSFLAERVIGLDVDQESIEFARRRFPRVEFLVCDLEAVDVLPQAEVYVAFEVLEHLERPKTLAEKISDHLVWSLPINNHSEFHRHIYSLAEAEEFLPGSQIWYQTPPGIILPKEYARFNPTYILGVLKGAVNDESRQ